MKKFPETRIDLTDLYSITNGQVQSKLLMAGIELKIFNHLCEPESAEGVARSAGFQLENTRVFLDGLVATGLVKKNKGRYQNTPETQAALVEGTQTYIGEMIDLMMKRLEGPLENLPDLVIQGPPPAQEKIDLGTEEIWTRYAASMANYQRAGLTSQAVEIVKNLPEFSGILKMLDLGGGPGIVGLAIVGSHPEMTGVIFDRPAVVRIAEEFIKEYEMESRVSVLGGDYMQDPIGEGYDLVWASTSLNFAGPNLDVPIGKIYDALNPGGLFISLADGLTREGTEPSEYVLNKLPNTLMGWDMGIHQGMIAESMERVGFSIVSRRTVETSMMPMDLDIAKKSR